MASSTIVMLAYVATSKSEEPDFTPFDNLITAFTKEFSREIFTPSIYLFKARADMGGNVYEVAIDPTDSTTISRLQQVLNRSKLNRDIESLMMVALSQQTLMSTWFAIAKTPGRTQLAPAHIRSAMLGLLLNGKTPEEQKYESYITEDDMDAYYA